MHASLHPEFIKSTQIKENGQRPITPHEQSIETHQAIELHINLYQTG